MDRRWRIAHRRLAHCRRSPHIISGANIPLALHMGTNRGPHPLATILKENISRQWSILEEAPGYWQMSGDMLVSWCKSMVQLQNCYHGYCSYILTHFVGFVPSLLSFSLSIFFIFLFSYFHCFTFISILSQFPCLDLSLFHVLFIQAHALFILTSLAPLPSHIYHQIKHSLFAVTLCRLCTIVQLVNGKVALLMRIPRSIG
jgi:hypothetical protein